MTEKRTRRYLIEYKGVVKPFVDAVALGSSCAAFAIITKASVTDWALTGGGFSLLFYWVTSNLAKPKKAKAAGGSISPELITLNTLKGSRKIRRTNFEYQPYQAGYVSRETFPEMLRRFVKRKPRHRGGQTESSIVLREFVFHSHYKGQPVELGEDDVCRFLNAAWRNRKRGSGLSKRRWVRDCRLRPQWYKDLGPYWYSALLALLREAQQIRQRQLVVRTGPHWYALAKDPHTTLDHLKKAEAAKLTS